MRGRHCRQGAITHGIERHFGNDADPQAQPDIGLDYVGVDRGQHHVGPQALALECLIDVGAPGKRCVVGNQRIVSQGRQRQGDAFQQWMARWRYHQMRPPETRQGEQFGVPVQCLGGYAQIRAAVKKPLADLQRTALLDVQANLGMTLDEALDHRWQGIARLGVGRRDGEQTAAFRGVILAHPLHVLRFGQDASRHREDDAAGGRGAAEPFAAALKNGHAEFFLKQANLFGNARLGCEKRFSCGRNAQAAPFDFHQIT